MKKNIFIGGAWPYANNSLHIGHLAALLPADVIARYYRLNKDNVIYISGSDCHGTPITLRARKEGILPKEIAEKYHNEFVENFNKLDFSYDYYGATMFDQHKEEVKKYFLQIIKNGYVYEKEEFQDYCEKCKQFLSDREIEGTCPHCGKEAKGDQCDFCLTSFDASELLNKRCKNCGGDITHKPNKHLYFKLSAFQDYVLQILENNKEQWRKNGVNETKKYLDMGLIDRAATRELDWGVEVPVDGYSSKRIYVWIEAVLGYLSAGKVAAEKLNLDFEKFITDKKTISYLVHGKDNIVFHTVIFPALLCAIDPKINLVKNIISCEYINMNNEKMSKSKGNLITVNELLEKYNPESIRYYMIATNPEKKDSNFSEEDFIQVHNKDLVGVLGNFINRNLSFIAKKFNGEVNEGIVDESIESETKALFTLVKGLIEKGELKTAITKIMDLAVLGNRYYDARKPWEQVKNNVDEFNNTTYTCCYIIANLSVLLRPFLPITAKRIQDMLNINTTEYEEYILTGKLKVSPELLFNRIDNPQN